MKVERKSREDTRFCPYCEETKEGALSAYCMPKTLDLRGSKLGSWQAVAHI